MLKRIFYASASVLMLALAFHLAARRATAQSAGTIEGACFSGNSVGGYPTLLFVVDRVLYSSHLSGSNWDIPARQSSAGPIPGTAPVAATYAGMPAGPGVLDAYVLLANGDLYRNNGADGPGATWQYVNNLLAAGPVPALRSTWGQLKARYRK